MEPRNQVHRRRAILRDANAVRMVEGNTGCIDIARGIQARVAGDPKHARKHFDREPGDPVSVCGVDRLHREVRGHTPMINGRGKSDSLIVPGKPSNKALGQATEVVEGRRLAKGNLLERNTLRTQGRAGVLSALERVRQAAQRDRKLRFTALLHHVYAIEQLRAAYFALKREAAPGVDGETWRQYGENLETNLQGLSQRLSVSLRDGGNPSPLGEAKICEMIGQAWCIPLMRFASSRS